MQLKERSNEVTPMAFKKMKRLIRNFHKFKPLLTGAEGRGKVFHHFVIEFVAFEFYLLQLFITKRPEK